jgi:GTP-binding protein EngB required for normal cell division
VNLELVDRFDALEHLVRAAWPHVAAHGAPPGEDAHGLAWARDLARRGGTRLRLSPDHTVVALAGATGSGKSSLFNALARMELSPVSELRPTTDAAHACVWGAEQPAPLLDWLGVDRWRRFLRESVLDAERELSLRGLVLLDLPDMDTVADVHRLEVDRLVGLADLVVWVLDPQKYADQAVHEEYLRRMDPLREVTVVVFNQVDRLAPADASRCLADLTRLVEADGLAGIPIIATSALTGEGVGDLRALLEKTVADRGAAAARLEAELATALSVVAPLVGPDIGPDAVSRETVGELADRLSVAAGVTAVAADAERVYLQRAGVPGRRRRDRGVPVGIVPADPVAVAVAVRRVAARVAAGLPTPWPDEVRRVVTADLDRLPDALSGALASARPRPPHVPLWRLARLVWWLAVLAVAAGIGWSGFYATARADGTTPDLPDVGGIAWPLLLLAGGSLVALPLLLVGRPIAAGRARRYRSRVDGRLREATTAVARDVLGPVRGVLRDYEQARSAYHAAGS